jgi:hypothetical protein
MNKLFFPDNFLSLNQMFCDRLFRRKRARLRHCHLEGFRVPYASKRKGDQGWRSLRYPQLDFTFKYKVSIVSITIFSSLLELSIFPAKSQPCKTQTANGLDEENKP